MAIQRVWRALEKEVRGLHEAAYLLAIFTLLSQILALLRDRLLAHFFGASGALDMYYAAFRVPDFLFVTIASLFSFSIVVPFLSRAMQRGESEARVFMAHVNAFFAALILGVSILVFVFLPVLLPHLFPGFIEESERMRELIWLTRLLLVQPFFLGLSGLLASVTQTKHRFVLYAISPIFYNVGIIAGILLFRPLWGVLGIGVGVVLGAIMHALVQIPFVLRSGFFSFSFGTGFFEHIRPLLLHALPRTLALSAGQIVLLLYAGIASSLGEGALAAFIFAYNLSSMPLSIIAASYATAAFPVLSGLFSGGAHERFRAEIVRAARHIIFWTFPALAFFIVLRAQIVRVVLGTGAFDWNDTRIVAAALALFMLSLTAQSLLLLFMRGFYATGNTRVPLFTALISSFAAVSLASFFARVLGGESTLHTFLEILLRVEGVTGTAVLALPLAFSLAQIGGALALMFFFGRAHGTIFRPLAPVFWKSAFAALILGGVSYIALPLGAVVFDIHTLLGIFLQGFVAGTLGIFAAVGALFLLKSEELSEVRYALGNKFWRARSRGVPEDITL